MRNSLFEKYFGHCFTPSKTTLGLTTHLHNNATGNVRVNRYRKTSQGCKPVRYNSSRRARHHANRNNV